MFGGMYRRRWGQARSCRRRHRVLLSLAFAVISWSPPEFAVHAQQIENDTVLQFDIPAQSLASALKVYGNQVQLRLFYDSGLMDGRQSPSVRGRMSASAALRTLLDGTGYSVTSLRSGTATILPSAPQDSIVRAKLTAMKSNATQFTPYFAAVQAGIRSALCQSPVTQVDKAERIIRLWIAPSGAITRAQLVSSAGTPAEDEAYAAAIRTLVIDQPPPANMPQPITMVVLPRDSQAAAECGRYASAGSGAP
jgi:Secretin and TonB N terminus short domain/TonB C terminal